MATVKEATDKFVQEFLLPNKGVYGVGHFPCSCCTKHFIEVSMNTNDKELVSKIPDKYMGYRVEKKFSEQSVAQTPKVASVLEPSESEKNKFKKEFEGKENYLIGVTKKGVNAIMNAPITGGYIPEDIGILLEVQNKNKTIGELKKSVRKYGNLEGLLIYLHTKGLISINGIISKRAENFSNARGRRRVAPRRRAAPRRSSSHGGARRHVNYVRRNYNRFYNVPYAVYPPPIYYFDVEHPKRIVITNKGLGYIRKHNKGAFPIFLSAIKNGLIYNEITLKNSLKIADWNRVVGWLYGNKMIDFV
jgi:hypothetical protein